MVVEGAQAQSLLAALHYEVLDGDLAGGYPTWDLRRRLRELLRAEPASILRDQAERLLQLADRAQHTSGIVCCLVHRPDGPSDLCPPATDAEIAAAQAMCAQIDLERDEWAAEVDRNLAQFDREFAGSFERWLRYGDADDVELEDFAEDERA
jgi:hypothetical protein